MPELSNVGPTGPYSDHVDVGSLGAVSGSNDAAIMSSGAVLSDFKNSFLCQFGHWVLRSFWVLSSILYLTIFHILGMCAKEEVPQIATWWVIAGVAHLKFPPYWPTSENPKQPMCPEHFSSESKAAISSWVSISAPFKAAIWHWNAFGNDILPKLSFCKSNHLRSPLPIFAHPHDEFVNHLAMLCRSTIRLN